MSSGAVVVAAICLACAGSSVPVISSPSPAASDLVTADGCAVDSPTGLTKQIEVPDGRGRPRQFDLFVTPGYDRHRPAPLVFLFHGTVSDSISDALRSELARHGDQAIIVTPQGVPFDVFGVGWNQACNGYDMPFYDAMVRAVSRRYCVDAHRIFASGFSWGADMVDALACCRGDTLRGIAPFSGDETAYNVACTSRSHPAVRQRYGSAQGEAGDGAYTRSQFRSATEFFRRAQSCAAESDPVEPSPCRAFRGCKQPVIECEYPNMDHAGPDASEIAATWRFWRALP